MKPATSPAARTENIKGEGREKKRKTPRPQQPVVKVSFQFQYFKSQIDANIWENVLQYSVVFLRGVSQSQINGLVRYVESKNKAFIVTKVFFF